MHFPQNINVLVLGQSVNGLVMFTYQKFRGFLIFQLKKRRNVLCECEIKKYT